MRSSPGVSSTYRGAGRHDMPGGDRLTAWLWVAGQDTGRRDRDHDLPRRARDRNIGDADHYVPHGGEAEVHQESGWWDLLPASRGDRALDASRSRLPNANGQRHPQRTEDGREVKADDPSAPGD
jgi:hypothetical protein